MKKLGLVNLTLSILAGCAGAGIFHMTLSLPVIAEENRKVIKAHSFILLDKQNLAVGTLSTGGKDGLPFLALEEPDMKSAILIGMRESGNRGIGEPSGTSDFMVNGKRGKCRYCSEGWIRNAFSF